MKGVIPSSKTVRRVIEKERVIEKGLFRLKELNEFLNKRNYPCTVWLSGDQTAINNKIDYHEKTNSVIGFTSPLDTDGLPVINGFPFNTVADLQKYFCDYNKSSYINVIIAQPLVNNLVFVLVCTEQKYIFC